MLFLLILIEKLPGIYVKSVTNETFRQGFTIVHVDTITNCGLFSESQ